MTWPKARAASPGIGKRKNIANQIAKRAWLTLQLRRMNLPQETHIRAQIHQRLSSLHVRLGDALANWEGLVAADEGARGARFVASMLHEVTLALDDAFRRQVRGGLHPLEAVHWIPALQVVRQDLRRAAASLNTLRGPRLERAVENLRRSLGEVQRAA